MQTRLESALDYLQERQLTSGQFATLASRTRNIVPSMSTFDSNVFTTALIAGVLQRIPDPRAQAMTEKSVSFLKKEMSTHGLWSFWTADSGRRIAADLDDTACVSIVLRASRAEVLDIRRIILGNRDEFGRFYTWIRDASVNPFIDETPSHVRDNVDAAVNANVLTYLGPGDHVNPVLALIRTALCEGDRRLFAYYLDSLTVAYFAARAFNAGVSDLASLQREVATLTLRRFAEISSSSEVISAACACYAMRSFRIADARRNKLESYLLDLQQEDRGWAAEAFFLGPAPIYGSSELTTAIVLDALWTFE